VRNPAHFGHRNVRMWAVLLPHGKTTERRTAQEAAGAVGQKAAGPTVREQIVGEICKALERLDADEELLAIVGSWHDTLDDADVLSFLRDWNAGRPTLHRPL
jgi:hypothetical protein